jgi:peroxiredoxin Q/BCP
MAQLRQDYEKIKIKGAEIIVVGPETKLAFKKYWQENKMPFIGLPDPEHTVLKQFGQQVKIFKFGRMPAQVIIDKSGTVRYVHYGHNMADIPETQEILDILDKLNKPA